MKVSCKLNRKRTKVSCRVKPIRARSARLVRGGRTVARGTVRRGVARFSPARSLARGTYALVAGGVTVRLTLR